MVESIFGEKYVTSYWGCVPWVSTGKYSAVGGLFVAQGRCTGTNS